MAEEFGWYVGIDWGSERHQACVVDGSGLVCGERWVAHGGEGLGELREWLGERTGSPAGRVAVAIERPHGPVVEALLEWGYAVYAINPRQLDRFRDRHGVSGAKDDRRDARVLGGSLRTDRAAFRRLTADVAAVVELREWSRLRQDLVQERGRLTSRLRDQLWRYYPQMLKVADDPGAGWVLALWSQAPTPQKAARLRQTTVERILRAHRIRSRQADEVLAVLRQTPLTVSPGTTAAAVAHIATLVPRLRLVGEQLRQSEARLEALADELAAEGEPGQQCEQRVVTILRSLPGVGRIVLATLLAEAWEPLRRRDYHALRCLSGVAPVTRSSGRQRLVIRRRACNPRLAEAVYHWARVAIQHDPLSRARYAALRTRGHSHGRAVRAVADRLLAVACTLLERGTPFDPHHPRQIAAAA